MTPTIVATVEETVSFAAPQPCSTGLGIAEAIDAARLSEARWIALQIITSDVHCRKAIARLYADKADARLLLADDDEEEDYLTRVSAAMDQNPNMPRPLARHDDEACLYGTGDMESASGDWDRFCSIIPHARHAEDKLPKVACTATSIASKLNASKKDGDCSGNYNSSGQCCELFPGSLSYLRLPALHEPALRLRIELPARGDEGATTTVLDLEQDGYLRPFEVSGILWPSGYLLTLCVSNPNHCGAPELHRSMLDDHRPLAVELGAGIGAPSIALALTLEKMSGRNGLVRDDSPMVVATDLAPHGLALTTANAMANGASVAIARTNYNHPVSLAELKRRYFRNNAITTADADKDETMTSSVRDGFSIVLGSSLQTLFRGDTSSPRHELWAALDALLDTKNPNSIAVLAHTGSEPITPPRDGSFLLVRKVSGDVFGMKTRDGSSSDFVLSFFQRCDVSCRRDGQR